MTRDGVLPLADAGAAAGGGGGTGEDGLRRCTQCGHHDHNVRMCTARPIKLFGVRFGDKTSMRKSVSMGNIMQLAEGSNGGRREEGYDSDGEHERPHKRRGQMAGFYFLFSGSPAAEADGCTGCQGRGGAGSPCCGPPPVRTESSSGVTAAWSMMGAARRERGRGQAWHG
jgi:hypothetical protein